MSLNCVTLRHRRVDVSLSFHWKISITAGLLTIQESPRCRCFCEDKFRLLSFSPSLLSCLRARHPCVAAIRLFSAPRVSAATAETFINTTGGCVDDGRLRGESLGRCRTWTKMPPTEIGPQIVSIMSCHNAYCFMGIADLSGVWRFFPNASGIIMSSLIDEQ